MEEHDERTFLCGYQNSRGYGSTSSLQASKQHRYRIIRHKVKPSDTLRGIVLMYNTSMSELKRMNRLWSNESLFLKDFIDVPVYDTNNAVDVNTCGYNGSHVNKNQKEAVPESVDELFRRIDLTIKTTSKNVRRLEKKMSMKLDRFDASKEQNLSRHSLNSVPGYQSSS